MRVKRALTVRDLKAYNPRVLPFEGPWLDAVGCPEIGSTWIIWGESFNGKTRFAMQLAKYMAGFVKVGYDSLEEGLSKTIREAVLGCAMQDVSRNFLLLNKESIPELKARMQIKKSPDVLIIASLQYSGLKYADYKVLRDAFPRKTFIFISHADGRLPKGSVANDIRYDASVKVYVEGYKAFPNSRYGGGKEYVIWPKGASEYWDYK